MKKKIIEVNYYIKGGVVNAWIIDCGGTYHKSVSDMKKYYSDDRFNHYIFNRLTKKDFEFNGMEW